ncbi:hypothetical protein F5Y15DRAFT_420646 [Xylariaceae sp. FL0016]|nr:hypothetical protein F5Y15DRAFT_420646 [Xylariaceae sp. FL0016]
MDPGNILPQLGRLDDELDNLEEALQPILKNVSETASKLPLLDKAKLYALVTYSIESMLFSSLRLNAVDAKNHPVFKELTRVRQYFEKIENIEFPPEKPEKSLNREAAIRFIRSDLAENKDKQMNTKLAEMIARERALAASKNSKAGDKRKANASSSSDDSSAEESHVKSADADTQHKKAKKENKDRKRKKDKKAKKEKSKKSSK